mmetsp:Transcript_5762/g.10548  ORF Transcript_5762/g.10548 Transcript_5762/m.10548 type:complete len:112 (-) Transcript_5762:454-789(-)
MGGNETDPGLAIFHPIITGGTAGILGCRDQLVVLADDVPNFFAGAKCQAPIVLGNLTQGHLFDKADIHLFLAGELDQLRDLLIVAALHHHCIDLDAPEAGFAGGINTVQHL